MIEQRNLEHALTVCKTLPLNQKAELIKQLLKDSKLLLHTISSFDEELIARVLRIIADLHECH